MKKKLQTYFYLYIHSTFLQKINIYNLIKDDTL
jgi:hypothetical protein